MLAKKISKHFKNFTKCKYYYKIVSLDLYYLIGIYMLSVVESLINDSHAAALEENYLDAIKKLNLARGILNQNIGFIDSEILEGYLVKIRIKSDSYVELEKENNILKANIQLFENNFERLLNLYLTKGLYQELNTNLINLKNIFRKATDEFFKTTQQLKKAAGFSDEQIKNTNDNAYKLIITSICKNFSLLSQLDVSLDEIERANLQNNLRPIQEHLLSMILTIRRPLYNKSENDSANSKSSKYLQLFREVCILGLVLETYAVALSLTGSIFCVFIPLGYSALSLSKTYQNILNSDFMNSEFKWWFDIPLGILASPFLITCAAGGLLAAITYLTLKSIIELGKIVFDGLKFIGNSINNMFSNSENANTKTHAEVLNIPDKADISLLGKSRTVEDLQPQTDKPALKRTSSANSFFQFNKPNVEEVLENLRRYQPGSE